MGIRQLRTLIAIADGGSFTSAARRLYLTQSAVSMQMKGLEDEMRTPLFDRKSRPPVLNNSGWRLVEEAREVLERYDSLRRIAGTPSEGLTGSVRLGVVPSIATRLLPDTLLELRKTHPNLKLQVRSGLSPELVLQVDQRQLDVVVVTEPDRLTAGAAFIPILEEEFKLIVHRDLAMMPMERMFEALSFVRFNPTMGIGRIIDAYLRKNHITVNDVMEFDTLDAIIGLVNMKLGIAIVPENSISRELADSLHASSLMPPFRRRVGLVALRGMLDAPTVRTVAEAFEATLKKSLPS